MTHASLEKILSDPYQLATVIANPEVLPSLPQTALIVVALPFQLAPFQARWLLGNCSDEVLRAFRELHPNIVVQQFGTGAGARYRYSKVEICRVGKVPL